MMSYLAAYLFISMLVGLVAIILGPPVKIADEDHSGLVLESLKVMFLWPIFFIPYLLEEKL